MSSEFERLERGRPAWVRVIDRISLALAGIASVMILVMMLQIIVDVFSRNALNSPLPATLEVTANWWMPAIVFLSLGYTQFRNEHVRATLVTDNLPHGWGKAAEILAAGTTGLVAALIGYYGLLAAIDSFEIGETILSSVEVVIWPARFVVPLGALILLAQCVATVYEVITEVEMPPAENEASLI